MSLLSILGVALALSMDAFAVSVGLSLSREGLRGARALRLAGLFGLFQFAMPIAGWAAGRTVVNLIAAYDHWLAAALLVFVGGKMIVESFHKEEHMEKKTADVTRGFPLLLLSVATSLDALAVGLSFGALRVPILLPAAVIGVVCFTVTMTGARIGPLLGKLAGEWAEIAGGVVLLAIAAKILVEHLK